MIVAAALFLTACFDPYRYGAEPVHAGKTTVYFVREVRGMNYDVIALSATPDACKTDSPANYVYDSADARAPFVRWDGAVLHVYSTSPATPPRSPFPVRVVQHPLQPFEFAAIDANPQRHGLRRVRVPLAQGSCP